MPKGGKSSLVPVRAGLRQDLDYFLRAFLNINSTKYCDFKSLFARIGVTSLFNGRSYYAEIIEFNECLLSMCLKYLNEYISLNVSRCIEERIFGVYSLYTFYYLQQADHVVKISMDPDLCENFRQLSFTLKESGYIDAYACILKLLEDKAIKIDAFLHNFDPSCYKQFDTDDNLDKVNVYANVHVPMANLRNMLNSDVFVKLNVCSQEYTSMKLNMGIPLTAIDNNPVDEVWRIVAKYEREADKPSIVRMRNAEGNCLNESSSQGMNRLTIKEKAYSSDLVFDRTRRHRNGSNVAVPSNLFTFQDEINEQEKTAKEEEAKKQEIEDAEYVREFNRKHLFDNPDEVVYVGKKTNKRVRREKKESAKPALPSPPPPKKRATVKKEKPLSTLREPKIEPEDQVVVKIEVQDDYEQKPKEEKPKGRKTKNSLSSEYMIAEVVRRSSIEVEEENQKAKKTVSFNPTLVTVREIPNRDDLRDEENEIEVKIEEGTMECQENLFEILQEDSDNKKEKIGMNEQVESYDNDPVQYPTSSSNNVVEHQNVVEDYHVIESNDLASLESDEEPPTDIGNETMDFEYVEVPIAEAFNQNEYASDFFLPFDNEENSAAVAEEPEGELDIIEDEADLAIDE